MRSSSKKAIKRADGIVVDASISIENQDSCLQHLIENPREFDGRRVITLAEMDRLHEKKKETAARAFRRARSKYPDLVVEGIHFFISPLKSRADKLSARENTGIGGNEDFVLLTEHGYLMICKSMTGRRSWEIQDVLVRSYFAGKSMIESLKSVSLKMTSMENRIDFLASIINRMDRDQASILEMVAPTRGRVSAKTVREHVTFVEFNYQGMCPICQSVKVIKDNRKCGDIARMGGRSVRETWLVCRPCRVGYQGCSILRSEAEAFFHTYQIRLRKNNISSLFEVPKNSN